LPDFCDKNKDLLKLIQKYCNEGNAEHDVMEVFYKVMMQGRTIPDLRTNVWEILQLMQAGGLITIECEIQPDIDNLRKIKMGDIKIIGKKQLKIDL
jgi:hypothetical protein